MNKIRALVIGHPTLAAKILESFSVGSSVTFVNDMEEAKLLIQDNGYDVFIHIFKHGEEGVINGPCQFNASRI